MNFENRPVTYIGWTEAARFCNWLHNGMPTGPQNDATTEDGAYDMDTPGYVWENVHREPDATWFLPSENEWYKAAYYDPFNPDADN